MNKRIYFLLLPLLLLVVAIKSKQAFPVLFQVHGSQCSVSAPESAPSPLSVSLDKHHDRKAKNAIRIKAWDDATTGIVFSNSYFPGQVSVYNTVLQYFPADACIFRRHISGHSLRGPPLQA